MAVTPYQDRILGDTQGVFDLDDSSSIGDVTAHLVQQTRRELRILSRNLDRRIYDQKPFLDALGRLAVSNPRARVRILLQDNQPAVKQGHRIIELARRLTSNIEIRNPIEEYRDYASSFLIADYSGYVHRELSTVYVATASYHAPLQARRLIAWFDEAWEHSEPDPEMRRLHI